MKLKILTAWMLLLFCWNGIAHTTVFSTWEGFEADKLASIWLIHRFISPGAEIHLYPLGKKPDKGIQFDTPYSKISRKFNQSTFESLLDHYGLTDPALRNIARLIHDIEINVWEKKMYKKTMEMNIFFIDLLGRSLEADTIIQKAGIYFDRLYEELPRGELESSQ